ncbi:GSCFA domain-containing protein [soil metagenome]
MKFMLDYTPPQFPCKISYENKCILIGSCFTEQIGNRLHELKFNVLQNPTGIVYDPLSIADAIENCVSNKKLHDNDLYNNNGLWHSWKHHSRFSGVRKEDVLHRINESTKNAHRFLKEADWLMITLGSSFYYQLNESTVNVANCHKAPAEMFTNKMLSAEQITSAIAEALNKLRDYNPQINFLLTVSPVRHIKDGIVENNLSKSRLIEAVHALAYKLERCYYFAAYELVVDVLRDYRFFDKDLVHPSSLAADFVFDRFSEAAFDQQTRSIMNEIKKWSTAEKHRPFHSDSKAFKKFQEQQSLKITQLKAAYPFINFD